jgi:hypothetical protein
MKSLDQHLEEINNMRKELALIEAEVDKLLEQCKQKPGFKYPIYMQAIYSRQVIKFTSLNSGTVVVQGKYASNSPVGQVIQIPSLPHTNTEHWQPIAFDEERGIADKQLVECWDNAHTHARAFRFYDAEHECAYSCQGNQSLISWDNYRPIPYADYPDWAIEAEKTLED